MFDLKPCPFCGGKAHVKAWNRRAYDGVDRVYIKQYDGVSILLTKIGGLYHG